MAILLSSHLLNQVQSVCDRIGIFAAGRLIGQGTMPSSPPGSARTRPMSRPRSRRPRTAAAIASARCSAAIPGVVEGQGAGAGDRRLGRRRQAGRRGDPRPAGDPRRRRVDRLRPDLGPGRPAVARGHLPAGRRAGRPRPREGRPMTAESTPLPRRPPTGRLRRPPRSPAQARRGRRLDPVAPRAVRAPRRLDGRRAARSSPITSGRPGSSPS